MILSHPVVQEVIINMEPNIRDRETNIAKMELPHFEIDSIVININSNECQPGVME